MVGFGAGSRGKVDVRGSIRTLPVKHDRSKQVNRAQHGTVCRVVTDGMSSRLVMKEKKNK